MTLKKENARIWKLNWNQSYQGNIIFSITYCMHFELKVALSRFLSLLSALLDFILNSASQPGAWNISFNFRESNVFSKIHSFFVTYFSLRFFSLFVCQCSKCTPLPRILDCSQFLVGFREVSAIQPLFSLCILLFTALLFIPQLSLSVSHLWMNFKVPFEDKIIGKYRPTKL